MKRSSAAIAAAITFMAASAPAPSVCDDLWGVRSVRGLLILKVDEGSPGAGAGVRMGDILEGFDDKAVTDFTSVNDFIAALKGAARTRDTASSLWQLDRGSGTRRRVSIALRLPDSAEAQLGFAVMPVVFFRELRAGGAAERAGVRTWDYVDHIEGESVSDRPRLDDFDRHVASLRNHAGNVTVGVVYWKFTEHEGTQSMESIGAREVVLPVAAR